MTLTFLGTRGGIDIRRRRRWRHSVLMIDGRNGRLMIDCGSDWLGRVASLRPDAILITHAHPDHVGGLAAGAPCPVYATRAAWRTLKRYPIKDRRVVRPRHAFAIDGVHFEAFPVEHSKRAPAVGYRFSCGTTAVFYVSDVAVIPGRERALRSVDLYIGDGATITRPILRRRGNALIGHAPIVTQSKWCRRAGIRRAIFTHCGTQIVQTDEPTATAKVHQIGQRHGIIAEIAHDGMRVAIPAPGP
jgi:phosphoribosyl 1,2-cyclic phosphodiesterase